jgi:hypothetical protein
LQAKLLDGKEMTEKATRITERRDRKREIIIGMQPVAKLFNRDKIKRRTNDEHVP